MSTTRERAKQILNNSGYTPVHQLTAQGQQMVQLMEEIVEKCESVEQNFANLDAKTQKDLAGAVGELAKLRSDLDSARAEINNRWRDVLGKIDGARRIDSHLDALAKAGGFFRDVALMQVSSLNATDAERKQARERVIAAQNPGAEDLAALTPSEGPKGGYLTTEEIVLGLIRNVEEYGMFGRYCMVQPMGSQSGKITRRSGGMTASYPDIAVSSSENSPTFAQTLLNLTTYQVKSYVDRFLLADDAVTNLGQLVLEEMAYALAYSEDLNGFVGDGTSTYAKVTGVFKKSHTGDVTADSGDDTFAEVIAKSVYYLGRMIGALPAWALGRDAAWYMNSSIFFNYLGVRDSQGMPIAQLLTAPSLGSNFNLFGFPVRFAQVAPALSATAVSTAMLAFGSLRSGWILGRHRMGVEVLTSEHARIEQNQVVYIGNVRQDIQQLDANAMARLITAAS